MKTYRIIGLASRPIVGHGVDARDALESVARENPRRLRGLHWYVRQEVGECVYVAATEQPNAWARCHAWLREHGPDPRAIVALADVGYNGYYAAWERLHAAYAEEEIN